MPKLTTPQWINATLLTVLAALVASFLVMAQVAASESREATKATSVVASDFKAHLARQEQFEVRVLEKLDSIEAEIKTKLGSTP